ncbi:hypothetical protein R1sor_000593 [Riccia sorocarpa]|uniref:BTB domain-containing protein n=1 Tax=Riccia sorocarpa TaxID=122646 RepID=A0ABD3GXR3_9MARC
MNLELIGLDGRLFRHNGMDRIFISNDVAHNLSRKEKRLEDPDHSRKEKKLKELEARLVVEESVKKKLRFLQAYEPGPLSPHFRGDMSFLGRDQEHIYAHRFIMEGKSTVFRRMFQNDMKEKESGTVRIDDASSHVIRSMVNFCYTTEIQFTEEASAEEVLKIAHKYDIKDLKDVCDEELCKDICEDNICRKLMFAHIFDAKKLVEATKVYFQDFFSCAYPKVVERLCRDSRLD